MSSQCSTQHTCDCDATSLDQSDTWSELVLAAGSNRCNNLLKADALRLEQAHHSTTHVQESARKQARRQRSRCSSNISVPSSLAAPASLRQWLLNLDQYALDSWSNN
jgi:hypothetical protein